MLAGCGDDTTAQSVAGVGGARVPAAEVIAAVDALCRATEQSSADRAAAASAFTDRAHDRLHDLAAALEGVDRSAAARLLVAKQRVEAALDADADNAALQGDLQMLTAESAAALDRLGLEAPECAR